jgi:hypothetical protein
MALLIAFVLIGVCSEPTMAQTTSTTTNTEMPFTATLTDCNGQPVVVSGTMHMVAQYTVSSNGGTHLHINTNWQDVSGSSGTTTYQAHSNNHSHFNSNGAQSEVTTLDDVRLVSAGPTDNLTMRVTMHTTINANGEVTASYVTFEVYCNG